MTGFSRDQDGSVILELDERVLDDEDEDEEEEEEEAEEEEEDEEGEAEEEEEDEETNDEDVVDGDLASVLIRFGDLTGEASAVASDRNILYSSVNLRFRPERRTSVEDAEAAEGEGVSSGGGVTTTERGV
jgi:hypothetical protein